MWEQKGDDKGRWTELVDSETGKSSIQEHKLKVIWTGCKEDKHSFEFTGNRELTCKRCGYVKNIIIGFEKLENGKVVKVNL